MQNRDLISIVIIWINGSYLYDVMSMVKIIKWLGSIELLAGNVYHEASNKFEADQESSSFLSRLSHDEAWHSYLCPYEISHESKTFFQDNHSNYLEKSVNIKRHIQIVQDIIGKTL